MKTLVSGASLRCSELCKINVKFLLNEAYYCKLIKCENFKNATYQSKEMIMCFKTLYIFEI